MAKWTDFYYGYGLIAGYGGYVFGDRGTKPSDLGLGNDGTVEGLNYAKQWYGTWPQGMQDTKKAGDFITEQFISKKLVSSLMVHGQRAHLKMLGLTLGSWKFLL